MTRDHRSSKAHHRNLLIGAALASCSIEAKAFPPYHTTDADTAEPWVLETRLGLLRATRDEGETEVAAPLVRLNLGLPHHLELTTEAEYAPSERRLGDAAAGAKWIPFFGKLAVGTEVLALLPFSDAGGIGIEAQALVSYRPGPFRLHLNAGGFSDGRVDPIERGFRASTLTELDLGPARPGLDLFVKRSADQPTQVLAGLGSIADLGSFDIRLGVHAGLTDASPDLTVDLWLSAEIPFAAGDSSHSLRRPEP
jgi:hypothetical protein